MQAEAIFRFNVGKVKTGLLKPKFSEQVQRLSYFGVKARGSMVAAR